MIAGDLVGAEESRARRENARARLDHDMKTLVLVEGSPCLVGRDEGGGTRAERGVEITVS